VPGGAGVDRALLQSLGWGVAVADPDTWEIGFENAAFFEWFPPETGEEVHLGRRLPGLDEGKARDRLEAGRPYRFELEVGSGARVVNVEAELRPLALDGREHVLVECRNVTKRKEVEVMLDSYSRMVEKNTRDLQREKERVEKLLLNIMPKAVYEEMKDFGSTTPQRFDDATILMSDFVGFTSMAISRDPSALVSELNDIFSAFDRIVELFNCERMKTIGDAYMAVAGLPEPTSDHAQSIARVALRLRRYLERRNASHTEEWQCRIGIHTGPVVGSIVGVQKYVYDIFGPGVNMASRMESLSGPMEITVSEDTYRLIRDEFSCTDRGEVEVKGFGTQRIYTLDAEIGGGRR
jgi:class 3 adenylate cyclase